MKRRRGGRGVSNKRDIGGERPVAADYAVAMRSFETAPGNSTDCKTSFAFSEQLMMTKKAVATLTDIAGVFVRYLNDVETLNQDTRDALVREARPEVTCAHAANSVSSLWVTATKICQVRHRVLSIHAAQALQM